MTMTMMMMMMMTVVLVVMVLVLVPRRGADDGDGGNDEWPQVGVKFTQIL